VITGLGRVWPAIPALLLAVSCSGGSVHAPESAPPLPAPDQGLEASHPHAEAFDVLVTKLAAIAGVPETEITRATPLSGLLKGEQEWAALEGVLTRDCGLPLDLVRQRWSADRTVGDWVDEIVAYDDRSARASPAP
jgi:hypothetical protein